MEEYALDAVKVTKLFIFFESHVFNEFLCSINIPYCLSFLTHCSHLVHVKETINSFDF